MGGQKGIVLIAMGACCLFSCFGSAEARPSFQGLGDLSGGAFWSEAQGISDDGTVVVGHSKAAASGGDYEAFRWTEAGGMQPLGMLSGGQRSYAWDVSTDGSVIVGTAYAGGLRAFRWTEAGGMQNLGTFQNSYVPHPESWGFALSSTGNTIVGEGHLPYSYSRGACRWDAGTGPVALPDLPVGESSLARGISADGSVIVGQIGGRAAQWTGGGGLMLLPALPSGTLPFEAYAASADGSVIVGKAETPGFPQAFRWTAAGGSQPLATRWSDAFDCSADGSVVVGAGLNTAAIWDQIHGFRDLQVLLEDEYGLDLSGWDLLSATAISADGLRIVGYGVNPSGQREAWLATLPEPATLSLLALGGLVAVLRRRRRVS